MRQMGTGSTTKLKIPTIFVLGVSAASVGGLALAYRGCMLHAMESILLRLMGQSNVGVRGRRACSRRRVAAANPRLQQKCS